MNNLENHSNVDVLPNNTLKTPNATEKKPATIEKGESLSTFVDKSVDTLGKLFRGAKKEGVEYTAAKHPTDTEKIKMSKDGSKYLIEQSILDGGVGYSINLSTKEGKKYSIVLGVDESAALGEQGYLSVKDSSEKELPVKNARDIVKKYINPLK